MGTVLTAKRYVGLTPLLRALVVTNQELGYANTIPFLSKCLSADASADGHIAVVRTTTTVAMPPNHGVLQRFTPRQRYSAPPAFRPPAVALVDGWSASRACACAGKRELAFARAAPGRA